METKLLDGATLKRMLYGGARAIRSELQAINDLNVFPVPDGDTGTNMTRTVESGIARISTAAASSVGDIYLDFAEGALFGARGNSGVILSQFIAGISDALKDKKTASTLELAEAFRAGVRRAYSAVATPVEGTMLTVFRESTEHAGKMVNEDSSIDEYLVHLIDEAKRSLERTRDILPVLTEADVVDSGGAGYLCIITGMHKYMYEDGRYEGGIGAPESQEARYELFTADSSLEFGYCTECLVRLLRQRGEPEDFDKDAFVAELEALGCESIVALRSGDVLKLHAHTFRPSAVLDACQRYGEFLNVKIENMSLQHTETKITKERKKAWGVVTVASGEGMVALFKQLGADEIIDGGQTANPSAEDFVGAFKRTNAKRLLVLPNNSNVYLTAMQAAELWEDGGVTVIPTKTIPEGYAALAVFNSECTDEDEQIRDMTAACDAVTTAELTVAIRDTKLCGIDVKEGNAIGILNGELRAASPSMLQTARELILGIDDIDERELITVFVGEGVEDEERIELTDMLEEALPDMEVNVVIGGQSVYKYLIAVE